MRKLFFFKKYLLFIIVFFKLSVSNLYANEPIYFCGGSYDSDYYYYNLFNQENISQKAFYPFLRTDQSPFYKSLQPKDSENIQLWYQFFNEKYSIEILVEVIYGKEEKFQLLKSNKEKESAAIRYLKFAKSTEKVTVNNSRYYWDYDKLIKGRKENAPQLINEGLKLYNKEKNKGLKQRYAYQLIRLYRYNHRFKLALDFFENEKESFKFKNEIYYYILDQVGGCYYKTKQYEKAAYTFLNVFDKSIDKKQSAFVSYKFCTYKKAEGKSLLKTNEEKANQIFITGLRSFSDTMQDLKKITELGIAEDKQELLAIRILNNLERTILGVNFRKNIFQKEAETNGKLNELLRFIIRKINNKHNIEFWKLTEAYVLFLKENIGEAKSKLKLITSKKFKKQKENLAVLFEVFSWQNITQENDVWLTKLFSKDAESIAVLDQCNYTDIIDERLGCSLKNIIIEQLSHLYLKEDKIAQSYLLHNYLENIEGTPSHKLVDELTRFVKKKNKSGFEKLLLKRLTNKGYIETKLVKLMKAAKGDIYFRSGNFNKALPYYENYDVSKEIPATIFSNNIIECFGCDDGYVMEDEVYKADVFSFLNTKMNKYNLLLNLQKLEELSQNKEAKKWQRKLALYLLGNYFFNVSNTGYYRTVVYDGAYWYNYYFGEKRPDISEVIEKKKTYSFPYGGYPNTYNGLANKAMAYYKETIALSSDNELNARCSYMIAKCELNDYYNNIYKDRWSDYDGGDYKKHKKEGFKALKTKYNTTKFYQKIRSKCSFFRLYDSN